MDTKNSIVLGTHKGINLIQKKDGTQMYYSEEMYTEYFCNWFSYVANFEKCFEFKTKFGFADFAFKDSKNNVKAIGEAKKIKDWKHALGQILAYKAEYPQAVGMLLLILKQEQDLALLSQIQDFAANLQLHVTGILFNQNLFNLYSFAGEDGRLLVIQELTPEVKKELFILGLKDGYSEKTNSICNIDDTPF